MTLFICVNSGLTILLLFQGGIIYGADSMGAGTEGACCAGQQKQAAEQEALKSAHELGLQQALEENTADYEEKLKQLANVKRIPDILNKLEK